jgi:hypothetical protein
MNLFYSSTTGRNEPFESTTCSSREKWVGKVNSLVPKGFSGMFRVFGTFPKTEEKDEDDLSGELFPVLAFNGYGKDSLGLGSIDCPEEVSNLEMLREDLVLFCRYILRLADRPVETFYLSNDPDSPEILTLEFEYGASNPGSFNVEVSPTGRICLPYIEDPFSIHDLWVMLPSLGWVPVLMEVFMQEARIEKLQVLPRSQ